MDEDTSDTRLDPQDLKGPVHNTANFSQMSSVKFTRSMDKGSKYLSVKESQRSIPIKSEFRSILIDYMHCHWVRQSFYDTDVAPSKRGQNATAHPNKKPCRNP